MNASKWMTVALAVLILSGSGLLAGEGDYVPFDLGKPLKDQAMEALLQGDHEKAVKLYERWLEADPRDESSWYNLACALALKGKKEKALTAFEKSVDAGWKDFAHASRDTDLESLREEKRFKEALDRCRANAQKDDGPKEYRRHFLPMKALWTYIVARPPDYDGSKKDYPLCVILHGSGSTELGHGRLADGFGREGVIYLCPRAPYPHSGVFMQMKKEGYTSWPPARLKEGSEESRAIIPQYVDWIFDCVADVRKRYRIAGEKVHILGHSQGAGFANLCALLHPEKVASYFSYAGYLPEAYRKENLAKAFLDHGVKPYLAHCKGDRVVPVKATEEAVAWFEKVGIEASFKAFEGGGHSFTPEALAFAREWLAKEVRPKREKEKEDEPGGEEGEF